MWFELFDCDFCQKICVLFFKPNKNCLSLELKIHVITYQTLQAIPTNYQQPTNQPTNNQLCQESMLCLLNSKNYPNPSACQQSDI